MTALARRLPTRRWLGSASAIALFGLAAFSPAHAAEALKIAVVDPLSGPAAIVTERILKELDFAVRDANAHGGVNGSPIEVLTFDNKMDPQETTIQAQKAIDAGATILMTGVSSSNTVALVEFVNKHNSRNPDRKVLVFDPSSADPVVTTTKCSYWSFEWVLNGEMKTSGLASFLKTQPDVKKVYLINPDGSHGQQTRRDVLAFVKQARPDIEFVADETHPLMRINDFAPYIAKIKASGADTVITSDWGADLALMLKSAGEAGLKVKWFTYFTTGPGAPTAIKQAGLDNLVYSVFDGDSGVDNAEFKAFDTAFRKDGGTSAAPFPGPVSLVRGLKAAGDAAKSTQPEALVPALEGLNVKTVFGADAVMRADDHQIIAPVSIASFGPAAAGSLDEEGTGWSWHTAAIIPVADVTRPSSCKMKRPS